MNNASFQKILLPNGVRLILIPMPGVASIASAVFAGVGSRYETPEINGISHFLEHMVFKGTEKYPTTDDVNAIERIGGIQNAYTDIDITNYHNKVLAEDWQLGLEINTQLALHPLLEEKHVDRERGVILEEMKRYEDEPAAKAEEVAHTMMYPGTKLGMRIIGEAKSLRNVTSRELRAYHDEWYTPERIVVVIAGNLNSEIKIQNSKFKNTIQNSKIIDTVNNWYGELKKSAEEDIELVKDEQEKPKVTVVTKKDAQQAHFFLSVRTFPRGSQERFAWSVFNLLMGISFTSRLFKEIREKRGLCYHIRSNSNNWTDVGNWGIYAGVATDRVSEAVAATIHELSRAAQTGVTEAEVVVAKKRLKTIIAFKSEDPEFMVEFYGRQELFGLPVLSPQEHFAQIDRVTPEEINLLTKKYFVTQNLNLALVWNRGEDANLPELLRI